MIKIDIFLLKNINITKMVDSNNMQKDFIEIYNKKDPNKLTEDDIYELYTNAPLDDLCQLARHHSGKWTLHIFCNIIKLEPKVCVKLFSLVKFLAFKRSEWNDDDIFEKMYSWELSTECVYFNYRVGNQLHKMKMMYEAGFPKIELERCDKRIFDILFDSLSE